MIHFNHPDEFLTKDANGDYIKEPGGTLKWVPATRKAINGIAKRGWIQIENQSPIIKGVNDDPDALRIMQRELYRVGVGNHYFFCGRDIIAYRAFNVPIERAWQHSKRIAKGTAGVECHARLSITHYKGKTEVVSVTEDPIPGLAGAENGVLIFKKSAQRARCSDKGKVCIVGRNHDAVWVRRLRRSCALRRARSL